MSQCQEEDPTDAAEEVADCYFFLTSECRNGSSCQFRHSDEALKTQKPCAYWAQGNCRTGKSCSFVHATKTLGVPTKYIAGKGNARVSIAGNWSLHCSPSVDAVVSNSSAASMVSKNSETFGKNGVTTSRYHTQSKVGALNTISDSGNNSSLFKGSESLNKSSSQRGAAAALSSEHSLIPPKVEGALLMGPSGPMVMTSFGPLPIMMGPNGPVVVAPKPKPTENIHKPIESNITSKSKQEGTKKVSPPKLNATEDLPSRTLAVNTARENFRKDRNGIIDPKQSSTNKFIGKPMPSIKLPSDKTSSLKPVYKKSLSHIPNQSNIKPIEVHKRPYSGESPRNNNRSKQYRHNDSRSNIPSLDTELGAKRGPRTKNPANAAIDNNDKPIARSKDQRVNTEQRNLRRNENDREKQLSGIPNEKLLTSNRKSNQNRRKWKIEADDRVAGLNSELISNRYDKSVKAPPTMDFIVRSFDELKQKD